MELVLMRMPRSRSGLLISQFSTNTLRAPPEISLPITTPPWPLRILQPLIRIFSEGVFKRRPSLFLPDLMAIQSSPVSKKQFSITTFLQDSGLQPSELGPRLSQVTPLMVTLWQRTGLINQKGALVMVTPSISTFSQS